MRFPPQPGRPRDRSNRYDSSGLPLVTYACRRRPRPDSRPVRSHRAACRWLGRRRGGVTVGAARQRPHHQRSSEIPPRTAPPRTPDTASRPSPLSRSSRPRCRCSRRSARRRRASCAALLRIAVEQRLVRLALLTNLATAEADDALESAGTAELRRGRRHGNSSRAARSPIAVVHGLLPRERSPESCAGLS